MATCSYCARSGLFLGVSQRRLCNTCEERVSAYEQVIFSSIRGHQAQMDSARAPAQAFMLAGAIRQTAAPLLELQTRGIALSGDYDLQHFVDNCQDQAESVATNILIDRLSAARLKASVAVTHKARVKEYSKVLLDIETARPSFRNRASLDRIKAEASEELNAAQLEELLEKAHKAEFKGQRAKALDAYRDALYFLQHDDIDDAQQRNWIELVEKKISEFSAEPPSASKATVPRARRGKLRLVEKSE